MMSNRDKKNKDWVRYTGLATEMMAAIGIAVFLGYKLDQWLGISFPLFLIIFPLLALGVTLWRLIKTLEKKDG